MLLFAYSASSGHGSAFADARRRQPHISDRRSYCDVRVFKFLKSAVCKAEQCVAIDMLHKISPGEAELLRDPAYNARLRFR